MRHRAWIDQIKAQRGRNKRAEPVEEDEDDGLLPSSYWAWNAFITMSGQRAYTDKALPLPLAVCDIEAYARLYSLTPSEGQILLDWMCAMDRVYLDHRFKQIEEDSKKNARKNRARNRGG